MIEIVAVLLLLILLALFVAALAPILPMRRRQGVGRVPLVTLLLLLSNILIFFAIAKNFTIPMGIAMKFGLVPDQPKFWALLTYMFLHGDLLHLTGNMLGLWFFAPHVEEALGRWEYLLLYLGAGVAGGVLQVFVTRLFLPGTGDLPTIGASGALFGVLGVFALRFWRTKVRVFLVLPIPAVVAVSAFALFAFISGVRSFSASDTTEGTAHWAHVGGFLFGIGMAGLMRLRDDGKREYQIEDAEKAVKKGDLDRGAAHYRAALEEKSDDAEAQLALARVCVRQRQDEAAHRHYVVAIDLYLKSSPALAARTYEEAVAQFAVFPLPLPTLHKVASACESVRLYPLAQRALAELCREFPQSQEAQLAMLRLGKLHLQKLGQPQNAIAIFDEFLSLYPDSEWQGHVEQLRAEARTRMTAA